MEIINLLFGLLCLVGIFALPFLPYIVGNSKKGNQPAMRTLDALSHSSLHNTRCPACGHQDFEWGFVTGRKEKIFRFYRYERGKALRLRKNMPIIYARTCKRCHNVMSFAYPTVADDEQPIKVKNIRPV